MRVDIPRRDAWVDRSVFGIRRINILVGIVDVEVLQAAVGRRDLGQIEVGLVRIAHQVATLVVGGDACLIGRSLGSEANGHVTFVEGTRVRQVAVLRDGHHVALARDEYGLVFLFA